VGEVLHLRDERAGAAYCGNSHVPRAQVLPSSIAIISVTLRGSSSEGMVDYTPSGTLACLSCYVLFLTLSMCLPLHASPRAMHLVYFTLLCVVHPPFLMRASSWLRHSLLSYVIKPFLSLPIAVIIHIIRCRLSL